MSMLPIDNIDMAHCQLIDRTRANQKRSVIWHVDDGSRAFFVHTTKGSTGTEHRNESPSDWRPEAE